MTSGLWDFSLSRRLFRDDRLASRGYATLFGISSILTICVELLLRSRIDPAKMSFWIRLPIVFVGVFGTLGMMFLWLGMWWYWVRLDDSGRWWKRFWFAVLLIGFWNGSVPYFIFVYLPQTVRKREASAQ
jgi:hypothetical protein